MIVEQGKPLAEARARSSTRPRFSSGSPRRRSASTATRFPPTLPDRRIVVLKQPVGVAAGITPWNFPLSMITRKAAPALAAGCTMVLKPAEQTPLSALALAELAERAGFPAGVFNVVTGDRRRSRDRRRDDFESARAQARVHGVDGGRQAPDGAVREQVKKISLELGGNAPFIVFDDADLDEAVEARCCSQVPELRPDLHLCEPRARAGGRLRRVRGADDRPGVEPERRAGARGGVAGRPAHRPAGLEKVEEHVADALKAARGSRRRRAPRARRTFFQPTVLAGVSLEMDICNEETFGPVAGLIPFETEEEAIRIANDTPFGLAAYFFARDVGRSGGSQRPGVRDRRHQYRLHLDRGGALRRRQGVRDRPRRLEVRDRGMARAQVPRRRRPR